MTVRMSSDEAWQMLASSHTGILTTLRVDGGPISLPVWFVALDERVYVRGPSTAKRHDRVRRNQRVAFLVESGERWTELRAVHLSGLARIVSEPELLERVGAALNEKYAQFRTSRAAMPDATRRHYDVELDTIEIVPDERILSWDNAKLPPVDP